MCVGTPMRVEETFGLIARCSAEGRVAEVDLSLVPEAKAGDHVLVFLGAARRLLDAEEARLITEALASLSAVMAGEADAGAMETAFADLTAREPELPPHLAAAYAAGRKEA